MSNKSTNNASMSHLKPQEAHFIEEEIKSLTNELKSLKRAYMKEEEESFCYYREPFSITDRAKDMREKMDGIEDDIDTLQLRLQQCKFSKNTYEMEK